MKVTRRTDLQSIASIVCEHLLRNGIEAVLTGGAVVSIYTQNEYESKDLDFVSSSDLKKIEKPLKEIGFVKSRGRYFTHPETEYFLEFIQPPLAIGNRPIKKWATQKNKAGSLRLLTPTHSAMDRLAGYFHWNDKQSLDQAVAIAKRHPLRFKELRSWAKAEGQLEKYKKFIARIPGIKNERPS